MILSLEKIKLNFGNYGIRNLIKKGGCNNNAKFDECVTDSEIAEKFKEYFINNQNISGEREPCSKESILTQFTAVDRNTVLKSPQ